MTTPLKIDIHFINRLNKAKLLLIYGKNVYDGVIQRFEFTFELSWKMMKSFLEYMGIVEIKSPRTTIKAAFSYGLIDDGEQWIDMMVERNKTSYDEKEVIVIYEKVKRTYNGRFTNLRKKLEEEISRLK
ncbi:HI0074 family nucleotidyltransferase substrate-binding subunit [Bacillus piscicola]|uniref:HI0074 family nucleotidyltransferase substrate-binding subunit n=1 Tax=Bacillus piscicola TaxID=1632684 RepID=UPI001F096508|nr:HI0074 family nucleotidyltransferase substrate-binding subunit [Bacillus piscicola]